MRAALVVVAVTACTPEITPGVYLCGPERACPEGLACNAPDNTCVLPGAAEPFACPQQGAETEPNDDAALAQSLGNLTCVSRVVEIGGCAADTDLEDWFGFEVPPACTAVAVDARLGFVLAFEVLELELRAEDGSTIAAADACGNEVPDDGADHRCLTQTLTPGARYALRVARSGAGDCGGECAHNRYTLDVQLVAP